MLDNTTVANLFQVSGGTTPVVNPGDPIGYSADKGTNGKPAIQATTTKRPLWMGSPRTLGAETVTNGRVVADASGWTLGSGWAWSAAGKITNTPSTATNLSQPVTLTPGQAYVLWFTVTRTAGTVTPKITGGANPVSFPARNVNSSNYEVFVAQAGQTTLEFDADASFAGSIGLVSLKPVTSWTNMGAYADGVDDLIATAAIDMTASQQATVVISAYSGWRAAVAPALFEIGSYEQSVAGSLAGGYQGNLLGQTQNGAAANTVTMTGDLPAAFTSGSTPAANVNTYLLDYSQSTIAGQLQIRARGKLPTQTATSNAVGHNALPNAAVTFFAAPNGVHPFFGGAYRAIVINRILTASEIANAEAWVSSGMVQVCVIGDSTTSSGSNAFAAGLNNNFSTASFVGGLVCGSANYSYPGDKIADQKTKLVAGGSANIANVKAGIIQLPLNDINTYIGGAAKTTAQIIADLQDLVNTYNSLKPAGTKTYISGMTPAKAWLGAVTGNPANCYQAWLDVNASISGTPNPGFNAITGVDARIMGHVASLNDGSGNLAQAYNGNYDGIHESNEARWIIAQFWRAQLEADGLLQTT